MGTQVGLRTSLCFPSLSFPGDFLPELQCTWHLNSSCIELCLGRICHECPNQVVAPLQARAMHNVFSFH